MKINPESRNNLIFIGILSILAFVSFSIYAPINYIFLNSDQGIHALMAADFDWKHCTYYWGQNRLGSIVPFIGSLFVKIGASPLWAVSIVQYIFLLATIVVFGELLSSLLLKIAFAVLVLFPLNSFVEIINIGHPYAPQLFFFLFSFWIGIKINNTRSTKNIFLIILFWVSNMISIWVSELSLISVALLVMFLLNKHTEKGVLYIKIKRLITLPFFYFVLVFSIIIPVGFRLIKLKFKDPIFEGYGVNSYNAVLDAFKINIERIFNTLKFYGGDTYSSVFLLLMILIIACVILFGIKKKLFNKALYKNYTLFILISIATFSAINFSEWAGIESFPHRYYVFSYFCLLLGIILLINSFGLNYQRKVLAASILIASIFGGASYLKLNKEAGRFKLEGNTKKQIHSFSKTTFIGDYWYTYIMGAYNANDVISIASEQSHLRNPHQLEKALKNESIFLIKNNWLEEFPDSISQYGRLLIKKEGEDFMVGNALLHKYINQSNIISQKEIDAMIKKIKADDVWMKEIKEKALERKISIDEMVKIDAKYTVERELNIKMIEEKIKKDKEWMEIIKSKAKQNNIPIDEMLRLDAEYIINQQGS